MEMLQVRQKRVIEEKSILSLVQTARHQLATFWQRTCHGFRTICR